MTKIVDIIDFHAGYGSQVRLVASYYNEEDENANAEHMRGYVPIRSHRDAFTQLALAQLPSKENKEKVFMLTGSFGTGKSHLCLMLANYFSVKSTSPEMKAFFDNWAKRDKIGSDKVRSWRGDGRYLVVPCDFLQETQTFEDVILTATEFALEKDGASNIILDTQFKSALSQIEEWENRQATGQPSGVFTDFLEFLGGDNPEKELQKLKRDLSQNKSTAIQLFQDTYRQATGQLLSFRTNTLRETLQTLLSGTEFQKRYKGMVILADEFGYALSEGRVAMSVFQGFAEMSKDGVAGMQLAFIGTGHRRFEAYGANTPAQLDFRTVQDRVTEVSLEAEELEQIIAALISTKSSSPEWQQNVVGKNNWLLTRMASNAKKLNLFKYLNEPEILEQIVKNIYPVHPLATYCLTRMSKELGSAARSVFSFFREFRDVIEDLPEGSYAWFVRNNEITKPSGDLSIYTPAFLALYFKESISSTNVTVRPEIRDYIRNYLGAVEEARRFAYKNTLTQKINPFTQAVLDLILVYRVSNINVTSANLEVGLNLNQPSEKKQLASEIKSLFDDKIIFKAPSGEYEFRRTDMADIESLINQAKQDVLDLPINHSNQMTSLVSKKWDEWTEAKGHNQSYLGDKRLLRLFAVPLELTTKHKAANGTQISYWEYLEQRRTANKNWNESYDSTMVYVLCETEADIQAAQQAVKGNKNSTVIVGVPRAPIPYRESVTNLITLESFSESDVYSKLEFQEKALVDEMRGNENQKNGFIGDFLRVRERYLEAKGLHWYREGGKTLVSDPVNDSEPADALMNELFKKRNTISHDYLSKVHPKSFAGIRDNALKEAVSALVQIEKPVQIDTRERDNRGEIRYLQIALAQHGILVQKADFSGPIGHYELEPNYSKYAHKYPALVDLIEKIKSIKPGTPLNISVLLAELSEAPYGLGPYALSIYFACAIRYLGDELRLKVNSTGLGYSPTNDADIIIDLATGKHPHAIFERRPLNKATTQLINSTYNMFSSMPVSAGSQQTRLEAWFAIQGWWKNRTRLERSVGIYDDETTVWSLMDMLAKQADSDAAGQTLLEDIKEIYGHDLDVELKQNSVEEITENLESDKLIAESRAIEIKTILVKTLSGLFSPTGETYQAFSEAINAWYENLHPDQKLLTADWQSPASKSILEAVPRLQDVEKMFLDIIPASHGFNLGKVDDWSFDQTQNYVNLFKDAFEKIETSLPKVTAPVWKTSVDSVPGFQGQPVIKYHGSVNLKVSLPEADVKVRITKNEDPITSKQFILVEKGDEEFQVTDSCTYLLVSQNLSGEFSRVVRVAFTNLDEGYKLISEMSPKLEPSEREYRFRNPVDKNGLTVLLKDIIENLKKDDRISESDILSAFKEALDTLAKKK
jgi:hypothetical protein